MALFTPLSLPVKGAGPRRPAQAHEDILTVGRDVHEVRRRIIILVGDQIDRTHAQVAQRGDNFDIVAGAIDAPDVTADGAQAM